MTKLIVAFIRPERLEHVRKQLEAVGIYSMIVTEVGERVAQGGATISYRGYPVAIDLVPKLRLEIVVEDDKVEDAIRAIVRGAYTGRPGDGRVIVVPLERSIEIRDYHEKLGKVKSIGEGATPGI